MHIFDNIAYSGRGLAQTWRVAPGFFFSDDVVKVSVVAQGAACGGPASRRRLHRRRHRLGQDQHDEVAGGRQKEGMSCLGVVCSDNFVNTFLTR